MAMGTVSGIALDHVVHEYERRGLDRLADHELVHQVAEVLTRPRLDPADSFVLHSPLELAARAALLPLVKPEQRTLARTRIVALAAHYEQYTALESGDSARSDAEQLPPATPASAKNRLLAALAGGDVERIGDYALAFADTTNPTELSDLLARDLVPLTAAAAHAPIFLFHLARRDPTHGVSPRLLVPLARELARHPDWRIRWADEWKFHRTGRIVDPADLRHAIAGLPLLGPPGSTFIHPLVMQVDETGIAHEHLNPVLGTPTPQAGAELLRIAARLMLTDTPDEGPYGWSHCLTIPQAVLGVTKDTLFADVGLAIAATHVAAFRVGLGKKPLDVSRTEPSAKHDPATITRLATRASISHDAHVVKYVLACIDAAIDDPAATTLFYAAAQRLLDIWVDRGGDPSDPLADQISG